MKSVGGECLCMHMVKPLELKYDTRMKESCKTDCRFGILVKNCIGKVTSDVSYVTSVTSVTSFS